MKQKLNELLKDSYSPYSKVKVSSIVITKDGKEYKGVNIENSSFGATICAERSAIFSAISNGSKEFKEIHLYSNQEQHLYPCFLCRQVMTEFFDNDTKIFIYSKNSEEVKEETITTLCPNSVTKESYTWEK